MPNPHQEFATGFIKSLANVIGQRKQDEAKKVDREQQIRIQGMQALLGQGAIEPGDVDTVISTIFGDEPGKKPKPGKAGQPDPRQIISSILGPALENSKNASLSGGQGAADPGTLKGISSSVAPDSIPSPTAGSVETQGAADTQAAAPAGGTYLGVPVLSSPEIANRKKDVEIGLFNKQVEALMAAGEPRESAVRMSLGFAPPAVKEALGYTLGPNDRRFDANNELVASGVEKSTAPQTAPPAAGTFPDYVMRYAKANNKATEAVTPQEIDALRVKWAQEVRPPATPSASAEARADKKALAARMVETVIANPAAFDNLPPTIQAEIIPDLAERGFSGFGKPLNESAVKQLSESRAALQSLNDLRQVLKDNEQYIGPLAGFQSYYPYSEGKVAQAKINLVKQRVGKALEGGVLRKEDEDKYKEILATLFDTPATAIAKTDSLIQTLQNDMKVFLDEQKLAGRRVGDRASSAAPEAPGRVAARQYLIQNKLPVTDANIDHYLAQSKK